MNTPLNTIDQLITSGVISENQRETLDAVSKQFNFSISPTMLDLIQEEEIHSQFVPTNKELNFLQEEIPDPIGDNHYQKIKGIVHRYPDRCLLLPITVCPVYCRFCFRREKVGKGEHSLSNKELESAFAYIESQEGIWEVILTGGDPLFMPPHRIEKILKRLAAIKHIEVLRIHTRIPLVDPERINKKMITALKLEKPVYVVLHANHPKEFTSAGKKAIAQLVDNGIPMLSQSVLLKGVNDSKEVLAKLMREFVKNRIKPYYLHQGDLAKGTSHFRTSIEEGQKLMHSLRRDLSGLCQPTYVLDIPGGYGKVPLSSCYFDGKQVEDFQGNKHLYPTQSPP